MGRIREFPNVRPIAGILTGPEGLTTTRAELVAWLGPLASASEPQPFVHSDYYAREMGVGLWRQFLVFAALRDPAELADWKLASNRLEARLGLNARGGRNVNVDPGYLAPGKLVLASTKDHEHRLYLRDGIYAEMTLRVRAGRFCPWEWTYPDYAQASVFFDQAYQVYLKDLKAAPHLGF